MYHYFLSAMLVTKPGQEKIILMVPPPQTRINCRGLLPYTILFLRRLPVIGHVLNMPGIKRVSLKHIHIFEYLVYIPLTQML